MEVKDILALANAGFTAEQIAILARTAEAQPPAGSPAPAQPPAGSPAPAQPPAGEAVTPSPWDDVMKEIKELKQSAVLGNILGSAQPAEQGVNDILAEIINPPLKEGDKK